MGCFAEFLLTDNSRCFDNPFQSVVCNNSLKNNLIFLAFPWKIALIAVFCWRLRQKYEYWINTDFWQHTIGKLGSDHFWQITYIEILKWEIPSNLKCDDWQLSRRRSACQVKVESKLKWTWLEIKSRWFRSFYRLCSVGDTCGVAMGEEALPAFEEVHCYSSYKGSFQHTLWTIRDPCAIHIVHKSYCFQLLYCGKGLF